MSPAERSDRLDPKTSRSPQNASNRDQTDDLNVTGENAVYNERLLQDPAVMPEMPHQSNSDPDMVRKEEV